MTGQRRNRIFLSHIRTPFGRTFIAHPAYREKQRKSLFLGERLLSIEARLGSSVDTGGENFVPAREGREGIVLELPWNRATAAAVRASDIVEERRQP
jgi:hypothetical protein